MVTISIFQDGKLFHANRGGRFEFVSLGLPTGSIGNAACFQSITIKAQRSKERVITESTYNGPVSICIHEAGTRRWIGIASAKTVAVQSLERMAN